MLLDDDDNDCSTPSMTPTYEGSDINAQKIPKNNLETHLQAQVTTLAANNRRLSSTMETQKRNLIAYQNWYAQSAACQLPNAPFPDGRPVAVPTGSPLGRHPDMGTT
ncbi:hypothetical protein P154DRAFT_574053 [Amniculicola lignicola CBS 123094]|uniref:Uncharacterized protein n=1 Tax=Amniculicola lignicola CBS 123094 TaxID=1392246 RepID=A0A6A5WKU2_9PLEO|nr:hypothetical protein P154DRAFT_574053 [Amniculicola lignicola CBS 123094]